MPVIPQVLVVLSFITLFGLLGCIALIDWRTLRIPNRLVMFAIVIAYTIAIVGNPASLGRGIAWPAWLAMGAIIANQKSTFAVGGGDTKLALVAGIIAGWFSTWGVFIGLALSGLITATLGYAGRAKSAGNHARVAANHVVAESGNSVQAIAPMGPGLVGGALVAFLLTGMI